METVYDWVTILGFAGLVTLFLQRSSLENPPDTIWHYLPPAIGAAMTNYFGNEGMDAWRSLSAWPLSPMFSLS